MIDWKRAAKAGGLSGVITWVLSEMFFVVNGVVFLGGLENINFFVKQILTSNSLLTIFNFAISGIIFGLIFALLFKKIPFKKSIYKGALFALVLALLIFFFNFYIISGALSTQKTIFLEQTNMLTGMLLPRSIAFALIQGLLLGYLWDKLGENPSVRFWISRAWKSLREYVTPNYPGLR